MQQNKTLVMTAEEVANELCLSKSKAYVIIRTLNAQLEAKGYLTVPGRISRKYFFEMMYGTVEN